MAELPHGVAAINVPLCQWLFCPLGPSFCCRRVRDQADRWRVIELLRSKDEMKKENMHRLNTRWLRVFTAADSFAGCKFSSAVQEQAHFLLSAVVLFF